MEKTVLQIEQIYLLLVSAADQTQLHPKQNVLTGFTKYIAVY